MTDIQLRQTVLDELAFEPTLDAAHIGVSVEDGIVTLSGHVRSYAEKVAAEAAVARVKGIRGIAEALAIVTPDGRRQDDAELVRQAISMIEWNTHIPAGAVRVKAENGWLTLVGEVDSFFERRGAEDAVHRLRSIKGVTNLINMRPDAGALDVEARVAAVLARDTRLMGHDIRAEVFGGRVQLTGTVNGLPARNLAERAAWGVPGVVWVDNHLKIEPARDTEPA